jgi:hypothetical protein
MNILRKAVIIPAFSLMSAAVGADDFVMIRMYNDDADEENNALAYVSLISTCCGVAR